jgi:hypothetical protein
MPNTTKLWHLLPVPILLLLSACATGLIGPGAPQPHPPTSDLCTLTAPITYDTEQDSADTVAQIEAFDAIWLSICEPAPAAP